MLAPNQGFPQAIALDDTHVYWATAGSIMRIPKSGAAQPTLVAGGYLGTENMVVDATHVYWNSFGSGSVTRWNKQTGEETTIYQGTIGGSGIAIHGGYLYWSVAHAEILPDGSLLRAPLGGGTTETLATALSPYDITVDATHVYWADAGAVKKMPKEGGPIEDLVEAQAWGVASDDEFVYWSDPFDNQSGMLGRVPKAGGTPEHVTDCAGSAHGLVVDATHVYWTDRSGFVLKAPKLGGEATVLAADQPDAINIALDDASVYWVNLTDPGAVSKVDK